MHRLLTVSALSLVCLSFVPSAHADANASTIKSVESQSAAPQTPPVYLSYMPFSWETLFPLPQGFFAGRLHQAIHVGLDKEHVKDMGGGIIQLTAPADSQMLRVLLKDPHCAVQAQGSGNTRLLFEADGGKTQVFVDTGGVVSSGSHSWRLTSGDFARLARTLDRIYAAPASK